MGRKHAAPTPAVPVETETEVAYEAPALPSPLFKVKDKVTHKGLVKIDPVPMVVLSVFKDSRGLDFYVVQNTNTNGLYIKRESELSAT